MNFWTEDREATLRRLRASGFSFGMIAKEIGCTRRAAGGKHWRLMRPRRVGPAPTRLASHGWSEEALTECWADRKARRAAERARP